MSRRNRHKSSAGPVRPASQPESIASSAAPPAELSPPIPEPPPIPPGGLVVPIGGFSLGSTYMGGSPWALDAAIQAESPESEDKEPDLCNNCRFWSRLPAGRGGLSGPHGECLRHAPSPGLGGLARWPITPAHRTCGDHKQRGVAVGHNFKLVE